MNYDEQWWLMRQVQTGKFLQLHFTLPLALGDLGAYLRNPKPRIPRKVFKSILQGWDG